MNNLKKIQACLFVVICCWACSSNTVKQDDNDSDAKLHTVTVLPDNDTPLDSVVKNIEYVKLKPTGNMLIGDISKIIVTDNHIIIVDTRQSQAVFVFDRQGNSLAVISRLGRGPEEYIGLTDAAVTPNQKEIVVLDNGRSQILYYDLSGKFIKKQTIPLTANRIEFIDDETMLFTTYGISNNPDIPAIMCLHYVDTDMNVVKSAFPTQQYPKLGHVESPTMKKNGDRLYASPIYSDTIYRITSDGMTPYYWIDMSQVNGITNRDFSPDMTPEQYNQILQSGAFFNGSYAESDNFGLFRALYPQRGKLVMYSKTQDKSYNLDADRLSTIFYLYLLNLNDIYTYKDQFVVAVDAFRFTSKPFPKEREIKLYEEIQQGLTVDDNPVLLFYTLKDPK